MSNEAEVLRDFLLALPLGSFDAAQRDQALAALDRLEAREANRRWNIDEDGDDLLICKGHHEKNRKCDFVRYVSASDRDSYRARADAVYKILEETRRKVGQEEAAYDRLHAEALEWREKFQAASTERYALRAAQEISTRALKRIADEQTEYTTGEGHARAIEIAIAAITTTSPSKEWCARMAEQEGDQEIGAGSSVQATMDQIIDGALADIAAELPVPSQISESSIVPGHMSTDNGQGMGRGTHCTKWECRDAGPLEKRERYWTCPKCRASYGE